MSFNGREGEHPIKTHSTNPSNNTNANSNSHSQYNNISTNQNRKTSTSNELQSLSHLLQIQSRVRAIIEQEDEKKRAIIEHEDEKKRIQQKYDEEQIRIQKEVSIMQSLMSGRDPLHPSSSRQSAFDTPTVHSMPNVNPFQNYSENSVQQNRQLLMSGRDSLHPSPSRQSAFPSPSRQSAFDTPTVHTMSNINQVQNLRGNYVQQNPSHLNESEEFSQPGHCNEMQELSIQHLGQQKISLDNVCPPCPIKNDVDEKMSIPNASLIDDYAAKNPEQYPDGNNEYLVLKDPKSLDKKKIVMPLIH